MRIIRVDEEPEYGVGLGSILVSLLEPDPGTARAFHRWYERDHFYAGCMTGEHFFAGRRFVATRALRELRYPAHSSTVADTSIGSYLALYWMERGFHEKAEAWAVERVLDLYERGRMEPPRDTVYAGFFLHDFAACRDTDGVPPELGLDHPFPGAVMVMSERPSGVDAAARERWLLEEHLPRVLPGSPAALCLSFTPLVLPQDSPVYTPPPEGFERRSLEVYLLDEDPRTHWATLFAPFGEAQSAAGMGEVGFAGGFIPTIPGSDRYVDEL